MTVAAKKKTTKKKTAKAPERLTAEEVKKLRADQAKQEEDERVVAEWEKEQELRKNYEEECEDLAPWVGWEEYKAARESEKRIKSVGIIGALLRGEKRSEIRKKWRISPGKLNALLNSEIVDNVLSYSLGHVYSFQDACVKAILHKIEHENDGQLAMQLLEKLGMFRRAGSLLQNAGGEVDGKEGENTSAEDIFGVLFAKGDSVQARQARQALEHIVVEFLKSGQSE